MKKFLLVLLVLSLALFLFACGSSETPSDSPEPEETDAQPSEKPEDTDKLSDGVYLVGTDIESGLYRVTVTDTIMGMGYVERSKDVSMEFDDIIANIALTGNGYVHVKDTDVAVKLQGVEAEPVDLTALVPDLQNEVGDGMYLVGYDIAPGTYKVVITDTVTKMGYVERLTDVSFDFDDIIANEVFQGDGYVKVEDGDYAIRVQGATLTLQ